MAGLRANTCCTVQKVTLAGICRESVNYGKEKHRSLTDSGRFVRRSLSRGTSSIISLMKQPAPRLRPGAAANGGIESSMDGSVRQLKVSPHPVKIDRSGR